MARRSRLVDVAKMAGVSPATVSRAVSQPELLTKSTLDHVLQVARELGYAPYGMARALASGRTMTIGAIVPTLDSTIFARMLQALQLQLGRDGYQLLVASHEFSAAAEAEAIRTLLSRGVDGLTLVGAERSEDAIRMIASAKTPVALTWCGHPDHLSVTVDNERAGRLAAEHVLALGHRRIGMVVGHLQFNDRQRARLAGARQALRAAGLELPDWMVSEQALTLAGGRAGCATLLEIDPSPSAIIGGIDIIAIGCMQEGQARGLGVPDALSIVGIDDIDMSAHLTPSLTTVHIPTSRIGQETARKLVAELRGDQVERQTELPIELVVRRSTAPRSADSDLARSAISRNREAATSQEG
ncbi:PurR Transcriptional regulators [Rhabdaerophilaceae bacterium]